MRDLTELSKEELIELVKSLDETKKQKQESLDRSKSTLKYWENKDLNELSTIEQISYSFAVKKCQKDVDWNMATRKNHRPPVALTPKLIQRPLTIQGERYDSHLK